MKTVVGIVQNWTTTRISQRERATRNNPLLKGGRSPSEHRGNWSHETEHTPMYWRGKWGYGTSDLLSPSEEKRSLREYSNFESRQCACAKWTWPVPKGAIAHDKERKKRGEREWWILKRKNEYKIIVFFKRGTCWKKEKKSIFASERLVFINHLRQREQKRVMRTVLHARGRESIAVISILSVY